MVMSKVDDNGSMASRCGSSSGQNGRSRITRKIIGLNDGRYMKYQVSKRDGLNDRKWTVFFVLTPF